MAVHRLQPCRYKVAPLAVAQLELLGCIENAQDLVSSTPAVLPHLQQAAIVVIESISKLIFARIETQSTSQIKAATCYS